MWNCIKLDLHMNEILDKDEIAKRYMTTYTPLVQKFCDDLDKESIDLESYRPAPKKNLAPAPFLPIIGTGYYTTPLKVAIFGMETGGWHDLTKFVDKFCKTKEDKLVVVKKYTDGNEDGSHNPKHNTKRFHEPLGVVDYWKERKNAFGFWTFAFSTLASIYNKSEKQVRNDQEILRSFIWGNMFAYERFDATWKYDEVLSKRKGDWRKIYNACKRFNRAQHILPYTCPQIMVVFSKGDDSLSWFTKKEKGQVDAQLLKRTIDWSGFESDYLEIFQEHINYYYLPETKTCVLHTYHPGYMRHFEGMGAEVWKAAIGHALHDIMNKNNISSQS